MVQDLTVCSEFSVPRQTESQGIDGHSLQNYTQINENKSVKDSSNPSSLHSEG